MSGPAADRIEQSKQIEGGSSIEGKIQQGLFIWAIRSMHRFEMTKVRLFFAKPFSLIIIIYLEDLGILEAKFLSEVEKLVLSNCCG